MSLIDGYNPPGSVTVADICALMDSIAQYGIVLGDIDNEYILGKLVQGNSAPTTSSVILYIENGRLVYGPATALGGGGGGGAPDIRPLTNNFTGASNTFSNAVTIYGAFRVNLFPLAAPTFNVVMDGLGQMWTAPFFSKSMLMAGDNTYTGNNTFLRSPTVGVVSKFTVACQTVFDSDTITFSQVPRTETAGIYTLMVDATGKLWKVLVTGNTGGGGGGTNYLPLPNIWTGPNTFKAGAVVESGFSVIANAAISGNLSLQGLLWLPSTAENNSPTWVLTLNPNTFYVEKTFLEKGASSAIVSCTNIPVGYQVTFNSSINHTTAPTTSMGDTLIPTGTTFTPGVEGRTIKGTLVVPDVKVTASGTAYLHIHVWANSGLVASFVEPANASYHNLTLPFSFVSVAGANPIIVRYAVEWSTGATGVVNFNETANGKYQPYLILEELLK